MTAGVGILLFSVFIVTLGVINHLLGNKSRDTLPTQSNKLEK